MIRTARSFVVADRSSMRILRALIGLAGMLAIAPLGSCREPPGEQRTVVRSEASRATETATREATLRAEQVCHVLQGGPAERRAACCGGRNGGHVEAECTRVLGSAIAAGRVAIDDAALSRCRFRSANSDAAA